MIDRKAEIEKAARRMATAHSEEAIAAYNAGSPAVGYWDDKATAAIEPLLDRIQELDAECERAWSAYRIAHDQAMTNGQDLFEIRAAIGIDRS